MNYSLSHHALERAVVRGCTKQAINLILTLHDRVSHLSDGVSSVWVSKERAEQLSEAGLPGSVVERIRRYLLVVDAETGRVVTIINSDRKYAKKYRHKFRRRRGCSHRSEW